jgi:hypothetical protein
MEIEMVTTIEHIQPIINILRGMAVHNVEKYHQAHAMRSVNELLEIFRVSIATASCEKVVDLVAKAGVVCMLHNSHELNSIVPQILDPGKHVGGKLLVGRDPGLRRGDTHMSLINSQTFRLPRASMLKLVLLFLGRIPKHGLVDGRHLEILYNTLYPCGDSVYSLPAACNHSYLIKCENRVSRKHNRIT